MRTLIACLVLSISGISSIASASEEEWINIDNMEGAPDGVLASVSLRGRDYTRYAVARNFNFAMTGAPVSQNIDGISVKIKGRATAEHSIFVEHLSIGNLGNYGQSCGTGSYWVIPLQYQVPTPAGGAYDLWGMTALAKSNVTLAGFGVTFSLENCGPRSKTTTAYIDTIEMTIYWTVNGVQYSETKPTGTIEYVD
jgi:hypothetical protein